MAPRWAYWPTPTWSTPEYAGVAEELEKKVVRQIALLAGYDPARATGIFTQGDVL